MSPRFFPRLSSDSERADCRRDVLRAQWDKPRAGSSYYVNGVLDVFFPPPLPCSLCRRPTSVKSVLSICDRCMERLPWIGANRCSLCGRAMMSRRIADLTGLDIAMPAVGRRISRSVKTVRLKRTKSRPICEQCSRTPPVFDYGRSYGVYDGYVKEKIHDLKYRGELGVAVGLGELLAWTVSRDPKFGRIQGIVPVPLHGSRLRERGFNQAEALAQVVGRNLKVRVLNPLVRVRETPPMSKLPWENRAANVAGAFAVTHPSTVTGKRLMVVDDVYTTGATVSAVALALKRAGARHCVLACVAAGSMTGDFIRS